jgi:hypothetical protein
MRTHSTLGNWVDQGHELVLPRAALQVAANHARAKRAAFDGRPEAREGDHDQVASRGARAENGTRAGTGERLRSSLERLVIYQHSGHLLSGVVSQRADMGESLQRGPWTGQLYF